MEMTPEEIIAQFIKPEQRILHIGGSIELEKFSNAHSYTNLNVDQITDLSSIPEGFDYVVMGDILEIIDNPLELIKRVKNVAKTTVIYEYKHDEDSVAKPGWKKPWQSIGLEYNLTREFDYVNNVFLGYATLHICDMPYNPTEKELEELGHAIR